ncbi:MAG: hypothetical protein ACTHNW_21995 [Mucilaginibacter sp.]
MNTSNYLKLHSPEEYRGFFIVEFAKLERSIDIYLSTYFIPNNPPLSNDLIGILIDRIPVESKRTALKTLFDIKNESDLSNHKKTSTYKKITESIRELIHIRNYFAHYHSVMISDKMKESGMAIGLVQFRDSLKIHWYTESEFWKLIHKITLTRNAIEKLRNSE